MATPLVVIALMGDDNTRWRSVFIVVGHFMIPYALLLSRDLKRNQARLRVIATWLLLARLAGPFLQGAPLDLMA